MDSHRKVHREQKNYSGNLPSNISLSQTPKSSKKKSSKYAMIPPPPYVQQYEPEFDPCSLKWTPQPRIHTTQHVLQQQRLFSTTSDPSVCHYPVPVSFSLNPVSLPVYPAYYESQSNSAVPLEVFHHASTRSNKKYLTERKGFNHPDEINVPGMFQTRQNDVHQDYTSLPPVNCDIYCKKSNDGDSLMKRRFSDPGLGQISSDDDSTTRSRPSSSMSSNTSGSANGDVFHVMKQVNALRESNSQLVKDLQETKLELETLKMQLSGFVDVQPGKLADAISEVRDATKMREETLLSKIELLFKENTSKCSEAHQSLERKLSNLQTLERLEKLEQRFEDFITKHSTGKRHQEPVMAAVKKEDSLDEDVRQQLIELELEKLRLRQVLQEEIANRKEAEATTQKLERLVSILRQKIHGVSVESAIPDEKPGNQIRPLTSTFDQNPFILANNKNGPAMFSLPNARRSNSIPQETNRTGMGKNGPKSLEGLLSEHSSNGEAENKPKKCENDNETKENEDPDAVWGSASSPSSGGTISTTNSSSSNSSSSSSTPVHVAPPEVSPISAQVTITGPVTDL